MSTTKLKFGAGALLVAGVVSVLVVQHQSQARLRNANESLHQQLAQLQSDYDSLRLAENSFVYR
jgi:cell division protein FtsL